MNYYATSLKPNASLLAGCVTSGKSGSRCAAGTDRKGKTIEHLLDWTSVGSDGSMVEALELSKNINVGKRRLK